ncbi:MAG TPA: PEP-CTERM sorting domain-containing protein [Verrucomicrobiae bacterium]|nr:PEP-CTERM sorting domain-containing protein [Verrucomicrobiae bacterium]
MTPKILLTTGIAVMSFGISALATTYSGNGNTGFGGVVGTGSLTLTDNGTTLSGTITRGSANFNDTLVIYIDSVAGGFADTSGFADSNDGSRKSISGFDGGSNRSLMTFAGGFAPDYAIALGPQNDSFGGLWSLANGGANSLPFVSSANLSPTGAGTGSTASFTFSISLASIGLTPGAGQSFNLFGTYTSDSGFRSTEAIAGNDSGTQGWNTFTQTSFATYTTTPVPEPTTMALATGGMVLLYAIRRRR